VTCQAAFRPGSISTSCGMMLMLLLLISITTTSEYDQTFPNHPLHL
jgi:hypothetical protein